MKQSNDSPMVCGPMALNSARQDGQATGTVGPGKVTAFWGCGSVVQPCMHEALSQPLEQERKKAYVVLFTYNLEGGD